MRKHLISTIFSVIAPLAALSATDDFLLIFSMPGPDRYADGTIVLDGECYALVWSPAGKAFSGFNADGTAASALDRVVLAGPLAQGGKCCDTLFQVDAATYAALEGGNWAVCLVDTRRANGVPAGAKDGKLLRVNRWGIVSSDPSIKPAPASKLPIAPPAEETRSSASAAAQSGGSGARATNLSSVPAGTQAPTITGMEMADGVVTLSVADTVPWLRYTIESGSRLGTFAIDGWADKVDGDSASEIVIETESTSPSRFFRVIRAE